MKARTFIIILVLVLALVLGPFMAQCHAAPPAHAGNGHPPSHAKGRSNNDPDDDGRGPDRGEGERDTYDHNNGCGNDPDRDDDCEGWCGGKPKTPPIPVHLPKPIIGGPEPKPPTWEAPHNCTIRLFGDTPELFPGWVDVRSPSNEQFVLAEAHNYLEYHAAEGTLLKVLWYDPLLGHAYSSVTEFVCVGTIVLYEPTNVGKEIQ